MKTMLLKYAAFVVMIAALFVVPLAFGQPDETPPAPAPEFPMSLLIPYFAGVIIHWGKKYVESKIQGGTVMTFGHWFGDQWYFTLTSFVVGVSALVGLFNANPEFYMQPNIGVWMQVVMTGIAGATLNTARTAPPPGDRRPLPDPS